MNKEDLLTWLVKGIDIDILSAAQVPGSENLICLWKKMRLRSKQLIGQIFHKVSTKRKNVLNSPKHGLVVWCDVLVSFSDRASNIFVQLLQQTGVITKSRFLAF